MSDPYISKIALSGVRHGGVGLQMIDSIAIV